MLSDRKYDTIVKEFAHVSPAGSSTCLNIAFAPESAALKRRMIYEQ